jgi:hypothetical protein
MAPLSAGRGEIRLRLESTHGIAGVSLCSNALGGRPADCTWICRLHESAPPELADYCGSALRSVNGVPVNNHTHGTQLLSFARGSVSIVVAPRADETELVLSATDDGVRGVMLANLLSDESDRTSVRGAFILYTDGSAPAELRPHVAEELRAVNGTLVTDREHGTALLREARGEVRVAVAKRPPRVYVAPPWYTRVRLAEIMTFSVIVTGCVYFALLSNDAHNLRQLCNKLYDYERGSFYREGLSYVCRTYDVRPLQPYDPPPPEPPPEPVTRLHRDKSGARPPPCAWDR